MSVIQTVGSFLKFNPFNFLIFRESWKVHRHDASNVMPLFKCHWHANTTLFCVCNFEMLRHVFTFLDSTPACRRFLWGSQRRWSTVMLQAAASWRMVILIMTIFGMTTHRGLYSQQVRLTRQAGLPRLFWQIQSHAKKKQNKIRYHLTCALWKTVVDPGPFRSLCSPLLARMTKINLSTKFTANRTFLEMRCFVCFSRNCWMPGAVMSSGAGVLIGWSFHCWPTLRSATRGRFYFISIKNSNNIFCHRLECKFRTPQQWWWITGLMAVVGLAGCSWTF